jgi:CBS domain-containing protein
MLAREIMTHEPYFVLAGDPIWRAAEVMRYHNVGCTPVVSDESSRRLVGMLTDRDIAVRCTARKHDAGCLVRAHMSGSPVASVSAGADVRVAMRRMEARSVRRIAVVSDDGGLVGIITQGDLLRRLGPQNPLAVERSIELISSGAHFAIG